MWVRLPPSASLWHKDLDVLSFGLSWDRMAHFVAYLWRNCGVQAEKRESYSPADASWMGTTVRSVLSAPA